MSQSRSATRMVISVVQWSGFGKLVLTQRSGRGRPGQVRRLVRNGVGRAQAPLPRPPRPRPCGHGRCRAARRARPRRRWPASAVKPTAWSIVSCGAGAAAAERDDGDADGARIDGRRRSPAAAAGSAGSTGAVGRWAPGVSRRSSGPPSAATMRAKMLRRAAGGDGGVDRRPPSSMLVGEAAEHQHLAAERHRHLVQARVAVACRSGSRRRSSPRRRCRRRWPSGSFMSVISAVVGRPAPLATRDEALGEVARPRRASP